jgi:hypothetical protein
MQNFKNRIENKDLSFAIIAAIIAPNGQNNQARAHP